MPDGAFRAALDTQALTGMVSGTRILTEDGECRVERLREGDRIATAEGGTVRLAGLERVTLRAAGAAAPLRIVAGAFGNRRDLVVAPGQLVALSASLVAAGTLADHLMVHVAFGGMVTYHQPLFDSDTVIIAEGAQLGCAKALPRFAAAGTGQPAQRSGVATRA